MCQCGNSVIGGTFKSETGIPDSLSCEYFFHVNLCLESDWPSSQTFHSSERRHRVYSTSTQRGPGLDREQVGEDVTGGKRPRGPSNKDITMRWK